MGRIIVEVMPKPEILDPQGPVTDELLEQARKAAEEVLSNPIIEDVVRVEAIDEADARYAGGAQ